MQHTFEYRNKFGVLIGTQENVEDIEAGVWLVTQIPGAALTTVQGIGIVIWSPTVDAPKTFRWLDDEGQFTEGEASDVQRDWMERQG